MEAFWSVWEIAVNSAEYFFFFNLLRKQLGFANKGKFPVFIGLLGLIAVQTILNFTGVDFQLVMLIMYALDLIYAGFCFNGTPAMRVLWGSCGMLVILIANLLVAAILSATSSIIMIDTLSPSISRLYATGLYAVICVVLFLVLSRIPASAIELPLSLQLFIIGIMTIGTVLAGWIVSYAISADSAASGQDNSFLVIVSAAVLMLLLSLVFTVHRTGAAIMKTSKAEQELQSLHLEQKNYERQQEMMRVWNHDHHHHITVLQAYLSQGEIQKADEYLRGLHMDLQTITTSINTGNAAADSILANKFRICQAEGILFNISVQSLADLPLSDMEVASLFGNLLDNAIDACRSCDPGTKAFIELQAMEKRGMHIITIVNSSPGNYKYDNGNLVTTKTKEGHGYGLPRIKQIITNSGGFSSINETENRFKITICLPKR